MKRRQRKKNSNPVIKRGTKSTHRGHVTYYKKGSFHYSDGTPPAKEGNRACGYCLLEDTPEGHDGCLGTMKGGVINACCGHGNKNEAYIHYEDGTIVDGEEASKLQESVGHSNGTR